MKINERYTVYRKAGDIQEEVDTVNTFDEAVDILEAHAEEDRNNDVNSEYRIEKKIVEEKKCHHNIFHK